MAGRGLCHVITIAVALAGAPAAGASSAREDVLLAVLGSAGSQLIAPARVASAYGTVTSGFRSVAHNRRVGGMPNSYHLIGRALDVARRPGVTHQMVDAALRRAGFVLVESLDEGDHSHFAFGGLLPGRPVARPQPPLVIAGAPTPAAPAKPRGPRVLADEHGELLVDQPVLVADVPAQAGSAAVVASR